MFLLLLNPLMQFISLQLIWALECAGKGDLSRADLKGKHRKRTPVSFNPASAKQSSYSHSFSEHNWGSTTRKLAHAASHHSEQQLVVIMEKVGATARQMNPSALTEAEMVGADDSDDEFADLCEGVIDLFHCVN